MSDTLTRWRIAATRIGENEGPPIEDEVESDDRPSDSEAARVLVQKSQMQGEPVPTGKRGATENGQGQTRCTPADG